MIIEAIIGVLFSAVNFIFTAVGVLPDMPEAIVSVTDTMQDFAISGMSLLFGILGKSFTLSVLTATITLILHHQIWAIVSWSWHKIRG